MIKRLNMAFDGWASQFENIPDWRPEITTKDNEILLDGQLLGHVNQKIESINIDIEVVIVYWEDSTSLIYINWPYKDKPKIDEIRINPIK